MSRTITLQGLTLAAIATSKKHFNARLDVNKGRLDLDHNSHSSMKSRSRALGHSACLKSMSRTITMQGLTLAAITTSEKHTLMLDLM